MSPPPDPSIPRKVSKWQLREIWNDPAFQSAMLRRCTERVIVVEHLAPPEADQQPGALSQVFDFYDRSDQGVGYLGTFHRYLNRDGSIGASGKLDPIYLMVHGVAHCDP